jgi:predicted metal-dependent peptidase
LKHFLHLDDKDDWAEEAERIAQRVPNPDLVVMLTDGYAPVSEADGGPMPKYQPQCPILWVLTPTGQEHESMGGRLVRIREE